MNLKLTSLCISCALALAACADSPPPASERATPAPAAEPAPSATPVATADPVTGTDPATGADASASPAATSASGGNEAVVENCSTTIEGNDAMQFNVGSITVPSSCSEFTITLNHVGRLPVAAMGHNVVVALGSDRAAIAADGVSAGVDGGYVKDGDARVIAHTDMIGGGQSTSVTFAVSAIQGAGPYEFFCSFPGHWAVMHGSIQVG